MYVDSYLAQVAIFAGNFAPRSWALCQGQLLSIAQNTSLFSLLGTTYGGDGQVTFALPDLKGRCAVHTGTGPGLTSITLGEKAGVESATLLTTQLPAHTHTFTSATGNPGASSANATAAIPTNNVPAVIPNINQYNGAGGGKMKVMNTTSVTAAAGSSQPLAIRQPYLVLHYVIALEGIFPSRN